MIVLCEYDVTGSRDDLKNRWELIPVGDRSPLLALDNLDLVVYNCLMHISSRWCVLLLCSYEDLGGFSFFGDVVYQ